MPEGIGKALASAIKDEPKTAIERGGRHIFQNQHRRALFSAISLTPCLGAVRLASELKIAQNTVEHHARALVDAGYLIRHYSDGRRVYYPDGLINHEEAELFKTLNHPKHGAIFRAVLGSPGLSQADIISSTGSKRQSVSKALKSLESGGILTRVADGTYTRFYPTRLLTDRADGFYKHGKDFSDFILKKLAQEGGAPPQIIKKDLERILVEVGYASDRFAIDIGINPYITCVVC